MKNLNEIPVMFENGFPNNYKNNVAHWGNFSKEELAQVTPEGVHKLLHLDIDLGNSCMLDCPHCFRRDDRFDLNVKSEFLKEREILSYLKEAKTLGLKSVKFLGRGEPFENKNFISFLYKLQELDIKASVFTKGHIIGNDSFAKHFNSHYGINNGTELAKELKRLDVSILLGFNSFNPIMQESFVNSGKLKLKSFTSVRNKALTNLVEAGLNEHKDGEETHLAIICAPIKPENIDEVFSIYEWGRKRNLYTVCCPSNLSGKGIDETERINHFKDYIPKLIDLYTNIYQWNISSGLQTIDDIKKNGISLYPGCHPCNQVAAGMYLSLSGKIFRCPGRTDTTSTFSFDIRKESDLKKIWIQSENYKRRDINCFNSYCPARLNKGEGIMSLPEDFFSIIRNKITR